MTPDAFAALAQLMRLNPDTPRGRALRAVLCDGATAAAAARAESITHPSVYRALAAAKETIALARKII